MVSHRKGSLIWETNLTGGDLYKKESWLEYLVKINIFSRLKTGMVNNNNNSNNNRNVN